MATAEASDDDDDTRRLAPPPSYASLASPLVPQQGFEQRAPQTGSLLVHPAFDHAYGDSLHLPRGCFIVRNAAQGKALDLLRHRTDEGAELGLHPIKQPQLKGLSLQHAGNNQLWFLDWEGHLVSAAASREIDVQDNRLVLAFPHPITTYPSTLSHPAPRFRLDPSTSTLHVIYSHNPSFTGPDDSGDWRDDDYIVEAVPLKRKPAEPPLWAATQANQLLSAVGSRAVNLGARVGDLLGRRFSQPSSPSLEAPPNRRRDSDELPLPPPPPPDKPVDKDVPPVPSTSQLPSAPSPPPASSSPLPATPPATAADDPDASDSDSEPSAYRPVRVVRLPPNWRDKFPGAALRASPNTSFGVTRWPASAKELRLWRRRQWDVVPVTVRPLPTSSAAFASSGMSSSGQEDDEGYVLPSPAGSDSAPRLDNLSYFGGGAAAAGRDEEPQGSVLAEGEGELYDRMGDSADDDAAEVDSRDFSPLAASVTGDLPPPSPSLSAVEGMARRRTSATAAAQLSGLMLGNSSAASYSNASSSRSHSDVGALATDAGHHDPLPLPPSPPLPSVPFSAETSSRPSTPDTSASAGADDEADMSTPRPDRHSSAASQRGSGAEGRWGRVVEERESDGSSLGEKREELESAKHVGEGAVEAVREHEIEGESGVKGASAG